MGGAFECAAFGGVVGPGEPKQLNERVPLIRCKASEELAQEAGLGVDAIHGGRDGCSDAHEAGALDGGRVRFDPGLEGDEAFLCVVQHLVEGQAIDFVGGLVLFEMEGL